MNRIVLGALAALMFVAAGLFWRQGRAEIEVGEVPPLIEPSSAPADDPDALPTAMVDDAIGPALPESTDLTREQRRFGRHDRNRDGRITRNELLSSRTAAFRKLDIDGNNLLTFEEWAVRTVDRFEDADKNADRELSPAEFRTTRPKKRAVKSKCRC